MLGYSPFYGEIIKKATVAFASIFTDIRVVREKNGKRQVVNVPIMYASGDSSISRKYEDPELLKTVATTLPKMSYFMSGIKYDTSRNINPSNPMVTQTGAVIPSPATYVLNYSLHCATANMEDMLQIVEQILPFFKPSFTISMNEFEQLGIEHDLTFTLGDCSFEDPNYPDAAYDVHRIIEWTFNFTVPVMFPILAEELIEPLGGKLIKQTDMRFYLWDRDDYYYHESAGPTVIPHWALPKEDWEMETHLGVRHFLIRYGSDFGDNTDESTVDIIGNDCKIYKIPRRELGIINKEYLDLMDNYLKDLIVKLNILPKGRKPTAVYDYKTLTLTLGIPKEAAPVKGKDYFTKDEIADIQDKIAMMFKNNLVVKYTIENKLLPASNGYCTWDIQHNIGSETVVFNIFDINGNLFTDYSADFLDKDNLRIKIPSNTSIKAKSLKMNIIG